MQTAALSEAADNRLVAFTAPIKEKVDATAALFSTENVTVKRSARWHEKEESVGGGGD